MIAVFRFLITTGCDVNEKKTELSGCEKACKSKCKFCSFDSHEKKPRNKNLDFLTFPSDICHSFLSCCKVYLIISEEAASLPPTPLSISSGSCFSLLPFQAPFKSESGDMYLRERFGSQFKEVDKMMRRMGVKGMDTEK